MGFEAEGVPDAYHGILRDAGLGSHEPRTPVRSVLGFALQGLDDDLFDLVVADGSWGAGARLVV